ncbi:hypothetical protein ABZX75_33990 [Streptomyces sp. NPDC003038]|uniref:hypothetical protein n=1 Tax=unclassified Streptomyces TaxID=2593676 RepID=UPI0033AB1368
MGAAYYRAESESGDHVEDLSEDALFMLIEDLNDSDNTFVVIQPDEDDPVWFTSVSVLGESHYEVVRRDTTRREHDVVTETSVAQIAPDLTIWMAARHLLGRPTQQPSNL